MRFPPKRKLMPFLSCLSPRCPRRYVGYDMMHYAEHHASASPGTYFGAMKRIHMKHHFSGTDGAAFGITSQLWDWAFGTMVRGRGRDAKVAQGQRS